MRILLVLEGRGGFSFDTTGRMTPVGGGSCIVYADDAIVYMDKVTSYADLREQMDGFFGRRELCTAGSHNRLDGDTTTVAHFVDFCLASRRELAPLPSEEALLSWLEGCQEKLYVPNRIRATITWPSGVQENAHFDIYEDAIERVLTGQVWYTIDPLVVLRDMGAFSATWHLATHDGDQRRGEYVAEFDLSELFEEEVV